MKASISFPELENLVSEKAKQHIAFQFVDGRTIRVTYPLNLGFIKKDISADLVIKELTGSDLLLQLSAGVGSDTLLTTLLGFLKDRIPLGLIEKRPNSHIMLHLDQVDQMKAVFEKLDIHDIHVINEGLEVVGTLK